MKYDFSHIEKKWQRFWDENQTFKVTEDTHRPKYYVLDMFPFPSGAGLHVGHPEGYTASDIVARYKRMKGFNVLHPMGWDSFGLPTENYAMKTARPPQEITRENVATFKRQLKSIGFAYDWSREVATSDPGYYQWTQWLFIQLFKKGLVYEDEISVNWCPALKTVLANEEVIDGKSEVGGHPVIRRPMKQWMLRITEYADRLLEDLELLDWPRPVKDMQKNWIGRSEGAEILFALKGKQEKLPVFTTRPDTLWGATYMVLAPEHRLVESITSQERKEDVQRYQQQAARKSDLERTELAQEKTGIFTGGHAFNPATDEQIPIWIADYVLAHYGSGAIMAVPAHDQRDYEFAKKMNLPIREVVQGGDLSCEAFTGDGPHVNSGPLNGLDNRPAIEKAIKWLEDGGRGKREVNFRLRDWLFSRQRYWGEPFPILRYEDGSIRCLEEDELPVLLPEMEDYNPSGTGESPLAKNEDWLFITDPKTGKRARRETHTMPQWAGSCWYYLRFCDPHNQRGPFSQEKVDHWLPVDLYVGGVEHAVLHLLYSRFWHKVFYDLGLVSTKEPFQKLVNQGMILGEDGEKMSKSRGNVINPDDVIKNYGADTLRLYEMFMGPLEKTKPWSMQGVKGVFGFISKAFRFFADPKNRFDREEEPETLKLLHKTIKKVTEDIEGLRFNTAISQMMIFNNHCQKVGGVSARTAKDFALILAPFAPHAAEEIGASLGLQNDLCHLSWPAYDPALAKDEEVTMAVQINGKTRATLSVSAGIEKDEFLQKAKEHPTIAKYLKEGVIVKEIFVPKKICNIVVRPLEKQ